MRNDQDLKIILNYIWKRYFFDVKRNNIVNIKFGKRAVKRLGSIRKTRNNETLILINGYFSDCKIPTFVLEATIAHELCHYAHGFGSLLPKLSPYPHRGGMIDREMEKRGLKNLMVGELRWLNRNWMNYIKKNKNNLL